MIALAYGSRSKLGRIEAMPVLGLVRAVDAVAIGKSRSRLGQVGVPHLIGVLLHADAVALPPRILWIEEAEVDGRRVLAEEGEVHSGPVPRGTERIRRTRTGARQLPERSRLMGSPPA